MTQTETATIRAEGLAAEPSRFDRVFDACTRYLSTGFAMSLILMLGAIVAVIAIAAAPAFRAHGWSLLTNSNWDPSNGVYGLQAPILGTIYSSSLALVIATVFGVAIAIFLSQGFLPRKLELLFKNVVELLAAIPSVVYGLWGIFIVIPQIRPMCDFLHDHMAWFPLFGGSGLVGPGMLPAAIVLAIMVLPTISAVSYDALTSVHPRLKEGAIGLGATRWEAILKVIVPTALTGIFGSLVLGFGRALGETMALAMLLGNTNEFGFSLFAPGNTLAALIANDFPEASTDKRQVLLFAGMTLLVITLIVNMVGAAIIQYSGRHRKGAVQ